MIKRDGWKLKVWEDQEGNQAIGNENADLYLYPDDCNNDLSREEINELLNLICKTPKLLSGLKKCVNIIDDNFDLMTPSRSRIRPNPEMPGWVDELIEIKELLKEIKE